MTPKSSQDHSAGVEARGPRADTVETVLRAAFGILIAEGAHALTPQRLHRETGVARTTIYRNWPETGDLVAAMLDRATSERDLPEFVGDLETDLGVAIDSLIFRLNHRPVRPLFAALVEHRHGPDDADDRCVAVDAGDLAAVYLRRLLRPARRAIVRAIDDGELSAGDPDELVEALAGSLLSRHVLFGRGVSPDDGQEAIKRFLQNQR